MEHPLRLYNSLTKQKEIFRPQNGNRVLYYSCGPTVYDEAHLGHARSYLFNDVLYRVLSHYFGYNVFYAMNITDLDDKIIKKARLRHLWETYTQNLSRSTLLVDLQQVTKSVDTTLETVDLLEQYRDLLTTWLDAQQGHTVQDPAIFAQVPKEYEQKFWDDMKALNIVEPQVIARVSDYIDEIISFIQGWIQRGVAYEKDGSVYFDTIEFVTSYVYGKLIPETFTHDVTSHFVLWKKHKPGEPMFPSPFGWGRPSWHVECFCVAGYILGPSIDIHIGGCDLKFPHHHNTLALAESYFQTDQWVHYFLHTGALMVQGSKMSKSFQNFFLIRDILKMYTPNQIRLGFLMGDWKDSVPFTDHFFDYACDCENKIQEFLQAVPPVRDTSSKWRLQDQILFQTFETIQSRVHEAMCDNIHSRKVLDHLQELMKQTNIYRAREPKNTTLLSSIRHYIVHILDVFGLCYEKAATTEPPFQACVQVLSQFRQDVRKKALTLPDPDLLKECDRLRDFILPSLGISLKDKPLKKEKKTVP